MITNPNPDALARIVINRVFQAPCAMVYRAWTDPKQMIQWWTCTDAQCRSIEADLKIGGKYRIHMAAPDGDHIAIGIYHEIIPNKRLRLTWSWESYPMPDSVLTIELEDLGQTTRLTLTHEGLPDQEDVREHTYGWNSLVEKLAGLFDSDKSVLR